MKRIALILIGLFFNFSAMAATVWAPTNPNGDVNILLTTYYTGNGILSLFDDGDPSFSTPLELGNFDTVVFTQTATGYDASNNGGTGNTVSLSDTFNFILAMSFDNGTTWVGDTSWVALGNSNAYQIFFGSVGQSIVVDVQAVPVQVVPVPAAVWLLITAFLSLFGFSRRRNSPAFNKSTPVAQLA